MGLIAIKDSGYVKTDNSGTRFTGVNITNAGIGIDLDSFQVAMSVGQGTDDTPVSGVYITHEVNVASTNNMTVTLTAYINKTDSVKMALIPYLKRLAKTLGYKTVYFKQITGESTTDYDASKIKNVVYHLSESAADAITAQTHIKIRVREFTIKQTAENNLLEFSLECVETA